MNTEKKLYKSNKNKMIDGVCGGIGEYFNIDPTLVRLGFVLLGICAGGGFLAYIIALVIIPRAPEDSEPQATPSQEHQGTDTTAGSSPSDAEQSTASDKSDPPTTT